mmetsp:Transcript_26735/g.55225  ORF Transcript_26735/g.55225 Transcript_26735/m.55225 type:complete len:104 (+) Transcript_26735:1253-1564(+)
MGTILRIPCPCCSEYLSRVHCCCEEFSRMWYQKRRQSSEAGAVVRRGECGDWKLFASIQASASWLLLLHKNYCIIIVFPPQSFVDLDNNKPTAMQSGRTEEEG